MQIGYHEFKNLKKNFNKDGNIMLLFENYNYSICFYYVQKVKRLPFSKQGVMKFIGKKKGYHFNLLISCRQKYTLKQNDKPFLVIN